MGGRLIDRMEGVWNEGSQSFMLWAGVTPFMHDSRVEQSHLNVVTL